MTLSSPLTSTWGAVARAGDALGGTMKDFRARLFRERNPAAYRILTDENPPGL
jgi:hypothetical protein